jgi:hypothetical protein
MKKFINFEEYICFLIDHIKDYLIFIVSHACIGRKLSQEHADLLLRLGLKINLSAKKLSGKMWRGYIAIINCGELAYENIADNQKELKASYNEYKLYSTFWKNGQCANAEVIKDGINYCPNNMRGLNFVVFDKNGNFVNSSVIDSFDEKAVFYDLTSKQLTLIELRKIKKGLDSIYFPKLELNIPSYPWGETAVIFGSNIEIFSSFADKYNFNLNDISSGIVISSSPVRNNGNISYVFNGCAFSRNDNKERIFIKGEKDILRNNISIKQMYHELGDFDLLTSENDTVVLSKDYFGLSKWFYYHSHEIFASATSFHMLVLLLKEAGVKLEINKNVVLSYFTKMAWYSYQLYTFDTFIKDIYYCPVDKDIKYSISNNMLFFDNTPFYYEQVDVKEFNEDLYKEYLYKSKDELLENMTAIYNHYEIDNVIVDVTDGLDTRTNIAVISLLPERLKQKTRIWSIKKENTPLNKGVDFVEDFQTALGIANFIDLNFVDVPIIKSVLDTKKNTISHSSLSYNFGNYFFNRDVNLRIKDVNENSIVLNGGNGERNIGSGCYGMFSYDLESDFNRWYEKIPNLLGTNVCADDKKTLKNIFDYFQAEDLQNKLDLHYSCFRHTLHFKNKYEHSLEFSSIQSFFAYKAKKIMQAKEKYPFFSCNHDLLTIISPLVANFPYISNKQNKRFEISEKVRITNNNFYSREQISYDSKRYDNYVPQRQQIYLPDKETYEKQLAISKENVRDTNFYDNEYKYFYLLKKVSEFIPELRKFSDKFPELFIRSNEVRVYTTNLLLHLYYLKKEIE